MTRKKYYVAVKCNKPRYHCDIIITGVEPTQKTHGHKYGFCFGGYATRRKALQVAMYQGYVIDNPTQDQRCEQEYR